MKKIIPILFVLVLLAAMTATAAADSFQINTDKNTVSAGESVTVSVVLDEKIEGSFRNVQGQLNYDPDILRYESHTLGDGYAEYVTSDMPDRKYVTFTNTDFTEDGFSNLPAGSVITVTFKANDSAYAEHLKTALTLNLSIQDTEGRMQDMTAETAVTICSGQNNDGSAAAGNDINETADKTKMEVCEKCGTEYVSDKNTGEQSTYDDVSTDSTESAADHSDAADEPELENDGTDKLLIIALITAAAIAGALIVYRRVSRR